MELIIEPKVLFLDEPTSGLDAHTAVSVVKNIKSWVDVVKPVIAVVVMYDLKAYAENKHALTAPHD